MAMFRFPLVVDLVNLAPCLAIGVISAVFALDTNRDLYTDVSIY